MIPRANRGGVTNHQLLAEAIRQEKTLQICARHPQFVYYDERECPGCKMLRERKNPILSQRRLV